MITLAAIEVPAPCQTCAIIRHHFNGFSQQPWLVPLFGFPPPKENAKDLKRSHSFEKLGPEHSEGLGKPLGERRKDNRVCYNKLVATGVSGTQAKPGPRERCVGHTQCCPPGGWRSWDAYPPTPILVIGRSSPPSCAERCWSLREEAIVSRCRDCPLHNSALPRRATEIWTRRPTPTCG